MILRFCLIMCLFLSSFFCNSQVLIDYKDGQIEIGKKEFNEDYSFIKSVDSLGSFQDYTKVCYDLDENAESGFYFVEASGGNGLLGYSIRFLISVENKTNITTVRLRKPVGFYTLNSKDSIFDYERVKGSSKVILSRMKRNGKLFFADKKNHSVERKNIQTNFGVLDSVTTHFGSVPRNVVDQILKKAKIWKFVNISQEKSIQIESVVSEFDDIITLSKDNKDEFIGKWKNLLKKINLQNDFSEIDSYTFPNDFVKHHVSDKIYRNCFSLDLNGNSIFELFKVTKVESDTVTGLKERFLRNGDYYKNIEAIKHKNGILKSVKNTKDGSTMSYIGGILVNNENDSYFRFFNIGGFNSNIYYNDVFSTEFKEFDEKTIALNGLSDFNGLLERFSCYFLDGLPHGLYRYTAKGKILELGQYKNGRKNGWVKKMDSKGRVKSSFFYEDGIVVRDSLNQIFEYFNFDSDKHINESPKRTITYSLNEIDNNIISKIEEHDLVVVDGTFDGTNVVTKLYNTQEKKLSYRINNDIYVHDVDIKNSDNKITFQYLTSEVISQSQGFHIKCKANPNTSLCLEGGSANIMKLIHDGKDIKKLRSQGEFDFLEIHSDGSIHYGNEEEENGIFSWFENVILSVVEFIFKPITEELDLETFGITYDSQEGWGIIVKKGDLPEVSVLVSDYYSFINESDTELEFFESYINELNHIKITDVLYDESNYLKLKEFVDKRGDDKLKNIFKNTIFEKESFNEFTNFKEVLELFLNEENYELDYNNNYKFKKREKRKVKLFVPKTGVPYYWADIMPPTIYGTIRHDYGGKTQGLLANREKGRIHSSVDYFNPVGSSVISPVNGKIIHFGYPETEYQDEKVRTIWIKTKSKVVVKLMYVTPVALEIGQKVEIGEEIGIMPDMHFRYKNTEREYRKYDESVTNHIHMVIELEDGTRTDRAQLFKLR